MKLEKHKLSQVDHSLTDENHDLGPPGKHEIFHSPVRIKRTKTVIQLNNSIIDKQKNNGKTRKQPNEKP